MATGPELEIEAVGGSLKAVKREQSPMGIFSRWTVTDPGDARGLDEPDREHVERALRDVRSGSASLAEFLKEQHLLPTDDDYAFERGRERVEKLGLLHLMQETCGTINELAGRTIVDAHSFLPPDPVLACFIFVENECEFVMRVELQGATPLLIFSERTWRDYATNDFIRWAYRLVEIEPMTVTVKLLHEISDEQISAEQVREWFFYLISGFDRTHAPNLRQRAS
jgi:hypothetical protein